MNPCPNEGRPISKKEFLEIMERYYNRIMVEDQGYGAVAVDVRDYLMTVKQSSVLRNKVVRP